MFQNHSSSPQPNILLDNRRSQQLSQKHFPRQPPTPILCLPSGRFLQLFGTAQTFQNRCHRGIHRGVVVGDLWGTDGDERMTPLNFCHVTTYPSRARSRAQYTPSTQLHAGEAPCTVPPLPADGCFDISAAAYLPLQCCEASLASGLCIRNPTLNEIPSLPGPLAPNRCAAPSRSVGAEGGRMSLDERSASDAVPCSGSQLAWDCRP